MTEQNRKGVLIVGGSVVGGALKLLLRGTDLDVTLLEDLSSDDLQIPEGTCLVLIAPGMDAGVRERLLGQVRSRARSEKMPILELVSGDARESSHDGHTLLLWPCPVEVLRQGVLDLLSPG